MQIADIFAFSRSLENAEVYISCLVHKCEWYSTRVITWPKTLKPSKAGLIYNQTHLITYNVLVNLRLLVEECHLHMVNEKK